MTLGETEDAVAAYSWPDDLLLTLSLSVGGSETWEAGDPESVRAYEQGSATFIGTGVWLDLPDNEGERKLNLYPTPAGGSAIELEYVYRPGAMVGEDDEPSWLPAPFHKGLLWIAASLYFETVEDNPELAKWNEEKADLVVAEISRYEIERRAGQGVFLPQIVGWTAA